MPPKKLSESDKQEILDRYCQSDETTVSLAAEFGVSTSTISRLLKQSLSEADYEAVMQRKRQGRQESEQDLLPGFADGGLLTAEIEEESERSKPQRRQRKRSGASFISAEQLAASVAQLSQLEQAPLTRSEADPIDLPVPEILSQAPILATPETLASQPFDDLDEAEEADEADDDDLDDDDLDDLDDDDDDDLDDYDDGLTDPLSGLDSMQIPSAGQLQILPFVESSLPRTCYVVVDRSSELITRPLKDFTDLGQLGGEDKQEKTLPIFDNHRVAKRFLRRMQRIVKVPDGRIFNKVRPYLQAKGITHLLIDGQVYSLQ
ncbi:MAG: hypothetical protein ACKO7W_24405 [Elainella sp.]